ncbi:hypothetical protein EDB83DRAFT_2454115, partial [Lactarius deliciosus]
MILAVDMFIFSYHRMGLAWPSCWPCILYFHCTIFRVTFKYLNYRLSLSQYCLRYACIPIVLCMFDPIAATVVRVSTSHLKLAPR